MGTIKPQLIPIYASPQFKNNKPFNVFLSDYMT